MAPRHRTSIVATFGLSLSVVILALSRTASGQSDDVDAVVARLPRAFIGDFRRRDSTVTQDVAVRFDRRRMDDGVLGSARRSAAARRLARHRSTAYLTVSEG
jgi:hypothetical protein